MSDLKTGTKVMHPMFGAGTVRGVSGSGPDAKITVDFGSAIGQKKLIASVANLKSLESDDGDAPPIRTTNAWFEVLDATTSPKAGRHPPRDKIHATISAAVRQQDFWAAVRERLRSLGSAPRVLDDLNENISITLSGLLTVRIIVRHAELVRPDNAVLARAIAETIAARYLGDFQAFVFKLDVGVQHALDAANLISISDESVTDLPDRDPKRRPLPVTPKGVITSRPKRRDDY